MRQGSYMGRSLELTHIQQTAGDLHDCVAWRHAVLDLSWPAPMGVPLYVSRHALNLTAECRLDAIIMHVHMTHGLTAAQLIRI